MTIVKLDVGLKIANEGRKAQKEIHEGKKSEQNQHKNNHGDDMRRSMMSLPSQKVYETYTPLNQEISVILNEMTNRDSALPPTPQKKDAPMGYDHDHYCRYHHCKGHRTNDCKILKRDIEARIQRVSKRILSPSEAATQALVVGQAGVARKGKGAGCPQNEKGNLKFDYRRFSSVGETSNAREVYAYHVSGTTIVGKHLRVK